MTATSVNQKEYLKKYLSLGDAKKRKKKVKNKTKPTVNRLQIVDDDLDIHNIRPLDEGELDLYELLEDAPQIAGIIDERPEEVKIKEKFGTKKWKVVADDDVGIKVIDQSTTRVKPESEPNSVTNTSNNTNLSPPRRSKSFTKESEKEKCSSEIDSPKWGIVKQDSDESPPRKHREAGQNSSVHNKRPKFDSDESPPRNLRKDDADISPPRRTKMYDSDALRQSHKHYLDVKYSRKSRKDDSIKSPPRRNHKVSSGSREYHSKDNHFSNEKPPPHRNIKQEDRNWSKRGEDNDLYSSSPRRNKTFNAENSSLSRRAKKYDLDESPRRRGTHESSDSRGVCKQDDTFSSRRRSSKENRINSDESPPRRRRSREFRLPNDDGLRRVSESLTRRERRSSMSPIVRNKKPRDEDGSQRKSRWGEADDKKLSSEENVTKYKERKDARNSLRDSDNDERCSRNGSINQTLDGRKAGLVGAGELKAEIEDLKKKEKEMFEKMDVNISGRGAVTIMRDRKTGKKRDFEEETRIQQEKNEKKAERDAKYMQWGKGLKQVTDKAQKLEDDLYEMSKPLARYADDADLDKFLRDQEREGDPMLAYVRKKKTAPDDSSKPKYEGSYMPNRFAIRPGYRWDGVDRSNGYEKQWFDTQNAKKALEEEAYKWSTSDM